ncbi:innexin unc-9-like [Mizuhopecten yessoensis]|uniref:Innexin n=1 Tax=Mizuhopecten yessoensis TaxID=6573 RepID=A0A210QKJ5_MIZYE|nr:innexin unc-9-like [Mizuhopecten yessoensis]OWF49226.1 Innexin unc-7 [Mizuhopecten yessoensis]
MPVVTFLDYILGPLIVNPGYRKAFDDNYIDRISRYYTIIFLLFFNTYVVTEEYVGEPIYCWCPPEFTDNEVWYTENVCWVSNTYYIPFSKTIPPNYQVRKDESIDITYYQWVPLALFFMALLCYIPRFIWRYATAMAGLDLKKFCVIAKHFRDSSPEEREMRLRNMATYMDVWCTGINRYRAGFYAPVREKLSTYCSLGCGRHFGTFYISLMLFIRFLYFANAFGQLFFLNEFLGNKFYVYGYEVFQAFLEGKDWTMSPRFPRVTLCDLEFRQLSNVQRHTLQCVLPINLFNEKIFLTLWFWFLGLSILSLVNLCCTIAIFLIPSFNESFIKKYLNMLGVYGTPACSKKLAYKFTHRYLRQDGVYVLKELSANANTAILQELFGYIWECFLEREKRNEFVPVYRYMPANSSYREMSLLSFPNAPLSNRQGTPLIVSNGTLRHISEEDLDSEENGTETFV